MHEARSVRTEGRARTAAGAAVLAGLMLTGCTGSPAASAISGRAILTGRLPGNGRPFTVGALRDGKIIRTAQVRPGGHFSLTVHPGLYHVGLWIPGAQHTTLYMTCTTTTTVRPGETSTVNLECMWH